MNKKKNTAAGKEKKKKHLDVNVNKIEYCKIIKSAVNNIMFNIAYCKFASFVLV